MNDGCHNTTCLKLLVAKPTTTATLPKIPKIPKIPTSSQTVMLVEYYWDKESGKFITSGDLQQEQDACMMWAPCIATQKPRLPGGPREYTLIKLLLPEVALPIRHPPRLYIVPFEEELAFNTIDERESYDFAKKYIIVLLKHKLMKWSAIEARLDASRITWLNKTNLYKDLQYIIHQKSRPSFELDD